jgi:hypothetical protein
MRKQKVKPVSAAKMHSGPKVRCRLQNPAHPYERPSARLGAVLPRHVFSDEPMTDDESEFIRAVRRWRDDTGNRFPTACDYRQILISLGYHK